MWWKLRKTVKNDNKDFELLLTVLIGRTVARNVQTMRTTITSKNL